MIVMIGGVPLVFHISEYMRNVLHLPTDQQPEGHAAAAHPLGLYQRCATFLGQWPQRIIFSALEADDKIMS